MKKLIVFLSILTGWQAIAQNAIQNYNWNGLPIGAGGYVTGVVYSPVLKGLSYCFTDMGGAYRWNSSNQSWSAITDSMGVNGNIEGLAADPKDSNVVYIASGGYVMRSQDKGQHWKSYRLPVYMNGNEVIRGLGRRLVVHPTQTSILYYGSRTKGLWQSTNSGQNWSKVNSFTYYGDTLIGTTVGAGITGIVFDPANPSNIYVSAGTRDNGHSLFRSSNGGSSWTPLPGPFQTTTNQFVIHHMEMASSGKLWVTYGNDYAPYPVYKVASYKGRACYFDTKVGKWTDVSPTTLTGMAGVSGYLLNGFYGGLSVDANNPNHVIISTVLSYLPDIIMNTTNSGASWGCVAKPSVSWDSNPANCTQFSSNGSRKDLAFTSTLAGTSATHWMEAIAIDPFDSQSAYYATGAGIYSTQNMLDTMGQILWQFQWNGLEQAAVLDVTPSTNGPFFSLLGDISGMRHSSLTQPLISQYGFYTTPGSANTNGLDFAGQNTNIVVRVTDGNYLGYSSDNGLTWTPTNTVASNVRTGKVAVSAQGNHIVYVPESSQPFIYHSNDQGASWQVIPNLTNAGTSIVSDRVDDSLFYAVNNGVIYVSTDGGQTFNKQAFSTGNVPNYTPYIVGPLRAVFGQKGEFWATDNNKTSNVGGPASCLINLSYQNGSLSFSKKGVGYWHYGYNTVSVGAAGIRSIGFGKAAPGLAYPSVYIVGEVFDTISKNQQKSVAFGAFRSDDRGETWTQINDGEGFVNMQSIGGDENVYGRAYLGTNGRGVFYGEPTNGFIDNCGVPVGGATGISQCENIPDGVYQILPVNNLSYCVSEGVNSLVQNTCNTTGSNNIQNWKVQATPSGNYTFQNVGNAGYMTIASASAGSRLYTSSPSTTTFRLEYAGFIGDNTPTYKIVPSDAISYPIGNKKPTGYNIFLVDRENNDKQRFVFRPIPTGSGAREDAANLYLKNQGGLTVTCYPNPFTQSIQLNALGDFNYSISSLTGKTVENGIGNGTVYAGAGLSAGMYILNVQTSNGKQTLKLIKE